jgi:hypothetical protein
MELNGYLYYKIEEGYRGSKEEGSARKKTRY